MLWGGLILTAPEISADVAAVRDFNRFYTARLGLLSPRHLGGDFSLTEARILYEIAANAGLTASLLRSRLNLDAGYISRTLSRLSKGKLLGQEPSKDDKRERLLSLTAAGRRAAASLDVESSHQMKALLDELSVEDRATVVRTLTEVHTLLQNASSKAVRIVRLSNATEDARRILEEYYDSLQVVERDTSGAIEAIIADSLSAMWLAYRGPEVVGCVVLRKLASIPNAAECKRLYVKPSARRDHVASRLLNELEDHSRTRKVNWIYLDSHAGLEAAVSLYQRRGYAMCNRYNSNPQATLFMRKEL